MVAQLTTKIFIEKAILIHGFLYDYSLTNYIRYHDRLMIICPIEGHGEFWQSAANHLAGKKCPTCAGRVRSNLDFIRKAKLVHGDEFIYSKVNYISAHKYIIIICRDHGEFKQTPHGHLSGRGCWDCAKEKRMRTHEKFVIMATAIHGNNYDYTYSKYIDWNTKIKFKCNRCFKTFPQTSFSHLQGKGCPYCIKKNETSVGNLLKELNVIVEEQHEIKLSITQKAYPDFYIPSLNLFIEYNGRQHYEPTNFGSGGDITPKSIEKFNKQQIRDELLRKYCQINKINLFEIDGRVYYNDRYQMKNYISRYLALKPFLTFPIT